jgi:hypothetical protein
MAPCPLRDATHSADRPSVEDRFASTSWRASRSRTTSTFDRTATRISAPCPFLRGLVDLDALAREQQPHPCEGPPAQPCERAIEPHHIDVTICDAAIGAVYPSAQLSLTSTPWRASSSRTRAKALQRSLASAPSSRTTST